MALQLAEFHAGVVTLRALVRFLKCVAVSDVAHQLARCGERGITLFALVGPSACVCVHVVRQRCKSFEPTVADITFMRPVFRVRFHMSGQQIALRARVVAVGACQLRVQVGEYFLGLSLIHI